MRHLLTLAMVTAVAMVAIEAPAEGPKTCNKACDDKYPQCVKDAIEYGYDAVQAKAGCQEKRRLCKERCK